MPEIAELRDSLKLFVTILPLICRAVPRNQAHLWSGAGRKTPLLPSCSCNPCVPSTSSRQMSLVARKPVFGVSDQVRHKPGCTTTEDGWRLEISDLGSIRVAKTKTLINFAVTAKLICVFVFAYAKSRFSNDAAQIRLHCYQLLRQI